MLNKYTTLSAMLEQINDHQVLWQDKILPCRIGQNGFSKSKQEGDGCTPTGTWKLLTVYYRPDKISTPKTALPLVEITPDMGWSDDPKDSAYNTCITTPYEFSHEKLWRDDNLYDVLITTSNNTAPVISGGGSAIFIHQTCEAMNPTAGCLALNFKDLMHVIETATLDTCWVIGDNLA